MSLAFFLVVSCSYFSRKRPFILLLTYLHGSRDVNGKTNGQQGRVRTNDVALVCPVSIQDANVAT